MSGDGIGVAAPSARKREVEGNDADRLHGLAVEQRGRENHTAHFFNLAGSATEKPPSSEGKAFHAFGSDSAAFGGGVCSFAG
jgi:hypothetical protein